MALGLTQPLTEMSTRDLPGGIEAQRVRLTTSPPSVTADCVENVGASTYHNPMGLHGLLQRQFYPLKCMNHEGRHNLENYTT
jgi:hypothetical protein